MPASTWTAPNLGHTLNTTQPFCIFFDDTPRSPHFPLSLDHPTPFTLGKTYDTARAYTTRSISAHDVFHASSSPSNKIIRLWEALARRVLQNTEARTFLLATKTKWLVYQNDDPVLGNGQDGKGENQLGLMLMLLRQRLNSNLLVIRDQQICMCPYQEQRTAIASLSRNCPFSAPAEKPRVPDSSGLESPLLPHARNPSPPPRGCCF